jgi:hypothetical protein
MANGYDKIDERLKRGREVLGGSREVLSEPDKQIGDSRELALGDETLDEAGRVIPRLDGDDAIASPSPAGHDRVSDASASAGEVERSTTSSPEPTSAPIRSAPQPPIARSGISGWNRPTIETAPTNPLHYNFPFPETSCNRVRAEMLRADRDFAHTEHSGALPSWERRRLAIRWVCRVLGVFANEACELARSGAPTWSLSNTEKRVGEVLTLLVLEAERTKFIGGDKPDLTNKPDLLSPGWVPKRLHAEIANSPEWSAYQTNLANLLDQSSVSAGTGHEQDRSALVDSFLLQCNQELAGGGIIKRTHIWQAAGHAHARQFEYWQSRSDKVTAEDERNFTRIFRMSPAQFVALLKKKGVAPSNS